MPEPLRVLVVEDSPDDADLMILELSHGGAVPHWRRVESADELRAALAEEPWDVALSDYNLPRFAATRALAMVKEADPNLPFVVVSGTIGEEAAVAMMRAGASDYILKGNLGRLAPVVERELREAANRRALEQAVRTRDRLLENSLREAEVRRHAIELERIVAERTAELQRSNNDLEQFAYVAAHDLQEPLRKVVAYTQLLGDLYKGRLDADADEFIGYCVDGAKRMHALIQDLLAYSRVGRNVQEKAQTDCEAVLAEALTALREAVREHGAAVTHDALPTLAVNDVQLVQLFQNLVGNAIKFHGSRPPWVHISAARQGADWLFTVADNGIGIDPKFAERVFVIFQRLHSRTEYPGTGMGLAIAKKIVERHGGRIWVEPRPGEGSCFKFTLPTGEPCPGGIAS
jgi:signal transduction histidine kinase